MATSDYKVLRAETVWHCDPSQGVKGSDKVYSVQLVQNLTTKEYSVESQYGKRGSNLKPAPTYAKTTHLGLAESAYNTLLQTKVKGKKGDAYDRTLDEPIIPTMFGGAGYSRTITKTAELKTAKQIDAFHNFLSNKVVEVAEPKKPKKEKEAEVSEGLAAMLAAFGDN